jgi:hypothetical protein
LQNLIIIFKKIEFTNRELAIGFWLLILIIFIFSNMKTRKPILKVIKLLFNRKLLIWQFSMLIYFYLMIYVLKLVGFWEPRLYKGAIIWLVFAGISSAVRSVQEGKDLKYFKELIKDNIKIFIVIQFIINLYSFSLIIEIIIVFLITFLTLVKYILENNVSFQNEGSSILKKFINSVLGIVGIWILFHSIKEIFINYNSIPYIDKLQDMLLPSILSIMFLLYIYALVIYSSYEMLFIRLSFMKTINDNVRAYLKFKIFLYCHIDISRIQLFQKKSGIMTTRLKNKEEVTKLMETFRRNI